MRRKREKMIEYPIRLQAYLAKSGLGSRRSCESLITQGRVKVDGRTVCELGTKVEEGQSVFVDDVEAKVSEKLYYYALNKPVGFVCTNYDPNEKLYARSLINIPDQDLLFNVGRLDKESEGLILFTNDGDFANKVTHPSNEVEKEYLVTLDAPITKENMDLAAKGKVAPYRIRGYEIVGKKQVKVTLTEGKNRELRNLFYELGYEVKALIRLRIASIELGTLKTGKYRALTSVELRSLIKQNPASK